MTRTTTTRKGQPAPVERARVADRAQPAAPPAAQAMLGLQRRVGNGAVARLVRGRPAGGLVVQRHSEAELREQIVSDDEGEASAAVVQRKAGPTAVQLHPIAPNAEWVHEAAFGRRKVTDVINLAGDKALQKAIIEAAKKLATQVLTGPALIDKQKQIDAMTWTLNTDPAPANPAQALPAGIQIWQYHPNYYNPDGSVRAAFVRSTMLHEAMHFVSNDHAGFQGVEKFLPVGEANDTIDEAVTEKLSEELASDVLGGAEAYTTNYWNLQARKGLDFHLTLQGLENLATGNAKLWLGDMVSVVQDKTGLTWDQIRKAFLTNSGGENDKVRGDIEAKRTEIAAAWKAKRIAAVSAQLGTAAVERSVWEQVLADATGKAKTAIELEDAQLGGPQAVGKDRIKKAVDAELAILAPGHEVVAKTDLRSSSLDDWVKVKKSAPGLGKEQSSWTESPAEASGGTLSNMPGSAVRPEGAKYTAHVIPDRSLAEYVRRSNSLLGGVATRFPMSWLIVPDDPALLGRTRFDAYPALSRKLLHPDLASKSLTDLMGASPDQSAHAIVERFGGAGYETNGDLGILTLKEVNLAAVLHEMGHHKQKHEAKLSEENVSQVKGVFPLLDLHNIIVNENVLGMAELKKSPKSDPYVRLRYTEAPTTLRRSEWITIGSKQTLGANYKRFRSRLELQAGAPFKALQEIETALDAPLYAGMKALFLNLMLREIALKSKNVELTDSAT